MAAFGPFPGLPVNPASEILARVADRWREAAPSDFALETHILPTEYAAVDAWGAKRLAADAPDLLIMLGYSSVADRLKIEARASNQCAPHLADASGFRPSAEAVTNYLPATLPLGAISSALDDAGIDHMRSDDCGEYVCNYIFFRVQQRMVDMLAPTPSGFVHIPPIDFGRGRVIPDEVARARPVDEIVRGVELIAATAARAAER